MKGMIGALTALLLGSLAVRPAQAQSVEPTPSQVRAAADAFDRGKDAYKAEDYVGAAEQFETADANAPSSTALELSIRSRDKAGQLDRAASLAALALQRYPDDRSIQKITSSILERARQELHTLTIKCVSPCELVVGGKLVHGVPATERTLFVEAGRVMVRAGWAKDRSASKLIDVTPATTSSLTLEPETESSTPHSPKDSSSPQPAERKFDVGSVTTPSTHPTDVVGLPPEVFWGGVIVTGIATGVLVWNTIELYSSKAAFDKSCSTKEVQSTPDCQDQYKEGLGIQDRQHLFIGVTAGLGAATTLLGIFATNWNTTPPSGLQTTRRGTRRYQVEPWVALGDRTLLGVVGRF